MHADNNVDIQEFMIMPVGARSFREGLRMGAEVFHTLRSVLKAKGHSTSVGDEGGFAPNLKSNEEALIFIVEAIRKAGYEPAATSASPGCCGQLLLPKGKYNLAAVKAREGRRGDGEVLRGPLKKYPIISIEDGRRRDGTEGKLMTEEWAKRSDRRLLNLPDEQEVL
jgi:enolase